MSNITGVAKPAGSESYGYDNLDRLDTFTLPGSSAVDYSYDLVGNRLSVSQSGVISNLTYASSANRLINNAGAGISYDANGNPPTNGAVRFREHVAQVRVMVSQVHVDILSGHAERSFSALLSGLLTLLGEVSAAV